MLIGNQPNSVEFPELRLFCPWCQYVYCALFCFLTQRIFVVFLSQLVKDVTTTWLIFFFFKLRLPEWYLELSLEKRDFSFVEYQMKCFTSSKCILLDSWITQPVKGSCTGQVKVFHVSASVICTPPTAFTNLLSFSYALWYNLLD